MFLLNNVTADDIQFYFSAIFPDCLKNLEAGKLLKTGDLFAQPWKDISLYLLLTDSNPFDFFLFRGTSDVLVILSETINPTFILFSLFPLSLHQLCQFFQC